MTREDFRHILKRAKKKRVRVTVHLPPSPPLIALQLKWLTHTSFKGYLISESLKAFSSQFAFYRSKDQLSITALSKNIKKGSY